MTPNNDFYMPVEEFANRYGLTTEKVVEMIRNRVVDGKLVDNQWVVDRTSRRTQKYLATDYQQTRFGNQRSADSESPRQEIETSTREKKRRVVAGLFAIFLGNLGIHKFYLGYTSIGLIYLGINALGILLLLIPNIVLGVIVIIEGIIYLTKSDEEFQRIYVDGRRPFF